jgi:ABC-2 type transport system permease protein
VTPPPTGNQARQRIHAPSGGLSARRIGAMVLRHLYVLRGSWPRVLELAYWPTVQMVIWGFLTVFLATNSSWVANAFGILLSAVLLWDVLFRGQLGFSISFLEEMWSRNMGNLFVSPLRPIEHVLSMMAMSLIRTLIGVTPAALLAIPLYHYSVFTLGLPLVAFFANLLVMGWAIGLFVTALILRYGLGAESLAWFVIFLLAPVSAVYYPVTVLPGWLQYVAWALPSTNVFEGMRAVLMHGDFRPGLLANAVLLNVLYLGLGALAYLYSFRVARQRGLLLQIGE